MSEDKPSVERRLYEAYRSFSGIRLSSQEVTRLLLNDDALQTRICNQANIEAGGEPSGMNNMESKALPTWRKLGKV